MSLSDLQSVASWMHALQFDLRKSLETLDSSHRFEDSIKPADVDEQAKERGEPNPKELKDSKEKGQKIRIKKKNPKDDPPRSRRLVLEGGHALERAHLVFTYDSPPIDNTVNEPKIVPGSAQATFTAALHPRNPYAPTMIAVLRFSVATTPAMLWSMDAAMQLSPAYGFDEDALHWHQTLYDALAPHDASFYPTFKQNADERFALEHRKEQLGIGGVSVRGHTAGSFSSSFAMLKSLGAAIAKGIMPILTRRCVYPSGERERVFQHQRRGRITEYLLHVDPWIAQALAEPSLRHHADATMPPTATWSAAYDLPDDTWERRLHDRYLVVRDWRHEARTEPPTSSKDNPVWPPKPADDVPPEEK